MPNKFARSNGNFNDSSIWSLLSGSMSPTTVPTLGDNASANTYTITITSNVNCDGLFANGQAGGTGGGRFIVLNPVTITCNLSGIRGNSTNGSGLNNSQTAACTVEVATSTGITNIIASNITGGTGTNNSTIFCNHTNTLNIVTSIINSDGSGSAIYNFNAGGVNVTTNSIDFRNITASSYSGIQNAGAGFISITSPITYGTNVANGCSIRSSSGIGAISITGNLSAGPLSPAIIYTDGLTYTTGDVYANTNSPGILGTLGVLYLNGNTFDHFSGRVAINVYSVRLSPFPKSSTIRISRAQSESTSNSFTNFYTSDVFSVFSVPSESNVRAGISYANNLLIGTCNIPSPSAVTIGTRYDSNGQTTGLSYNNSTVLFNMPLSSLTLPNTVGDKLKVTATTESIGHLIASFSN